MTIVVDANVALKWLLTEPGTSAALALLSGGEPLVAPAIVHLEVAGGLVRATRDQRVSGTKALSLLDDWNRMLSDGVLVLVPNEQFFDRAFRIGIEVRHTLIDCLYVAVAESLDATLVTADEPMHERCRSVHSRIELLSRAA
ncbi:MAG: type II toxin-antitoxin system VapC family toxin [Phycisphaerales bacterium]